MLEKHQPQLLISENNPIQIPTLSFSAIELEWSNS